MKNPLRHTTLYVAIGYILILAWLFGSSVMGYSLEKRVQDSTQRQTNFMEQKGLVETLYQNARERSIGLLTIVTTQDPFELDLLQQAFYAKAEQIRLAFEDYQALETTPDERIILQRLFEKATINRDLQHRVIELALQNQHQQALTMLVDEALPYQERVISLFQQLYDIKSNQLTSAQQQVYADINLIENLWIYTLIGLFIILAAVSFFSLTKISIANKIQQDFQLTLENKVNERTKEVVLDSAILQNIYEAIVVTTEKGELIKTNHKFNQLLEENQLTDEFYIWNLLPKLFDNIDVDGLFERLIHRGYARLEGSLSQNPAHHFLIDAYQINDVRLDHSYLSFTLNDISHLKQTQKELESLANFDLVTGLANRHQFQNTLHSWLNAEQSTPFALFFLDLDNFKWVNDTQGHAAGDKILQQVANLLSRHFPDETTGLVARLGGDEFAVIYQYQDELDLAKQATDLIQGIRQLHQPINPSQTLGCSIGIANYPKDGLTQEDLMRHADFAMYKAKEQGKNTYCLFSDKMNEHIHYLFETEINLHQALKNNEFFLVYQPQYRLSDLELVGAEALLRWQMADRLVPPDEFIPLAEKFGLIHALGGFVLQRALEQLESWQKQSQPLDRIAINVSSAQLNGQGFAQQVKQQLEQHNLKPHQLDLEITESLLIDHLNEDNRVLNELQYKGLEISIDDFGTGYSSLAYIKHLNVDRIKIDRSFIRDLDYNAESYSIVAAIITMGKSLGLKVLAEGIETEHQLKLLRELGCDEGQGYLLGRPQKAEHFNFRAPLELTP